MSSLSIIWQDARHRYRKSLSGDEQGQFDVAFATTTSVDDVLSAAKDIGSHKFSEKLHSLLTPLREISPVFDILCQVNGIVGCSIWAPLKLIIQISRSYSDSLDLILDIINTLIVNTQRYAVYERLHEQSPLVRGLLQQYYFDLIDICARCVKYNQKHKSVNIIRTLARPFKAELSEVITRMNRHANAVDPSAMAAEMEWAGIERDKQERSRKMTEGHIARYNKDQEVQRFEMEVVQKGQKVTQECVVNEHEQTKRIEILKWLSQSKHQAHHRVVSEQRLEGTGHWLLAKEEFVEWRDSPGSCLLWLHGIPGSGKSTLVSLVVDTLQKERLETDHGLAYFYCKRDYGAERWDIESIMRSIVKQLSIDPKTGALREELVKEYDSRKLDDFAKGPLELEASRNLILELGEAYPKTNIIIDALDECDPLKREGLLDALENIVNNCHGLMKVFVASRDDNDIVIQLEKKANLRIKASDNIVDIKCFVQVEVGRCISKRKLLRGRIAEGLKSLVIETLIAGADGMFLWVDLQIKHLCGLPTASDVKKGLGELPKGLEETYHAIWSEIESEGGKGLDLAIAALKWIMVSCTPLGPVELAGLVSKACFYNASETDDEAIDVELILKLCHNFLVFDREDNAIRFAHLSILEYLEGAHLDRQEAHAMAAEVCISLLLSDQRGQNNDPGLELYEGQRAYVHYAIHHWPIHVQACGPRRGYLAGLLKLFLCPGSPTYDLWYLQVKALILEKPELKVVKDMWYLEPGTLSSWPGTELAEPRDGVVEGSLELGSFDTDPWKPLLAASLYGIIDVGVEVLKEGRDTVSKRGHTLLGIAADCDQQEMVKFLVDVVGIGVDFRDHRSGRTPLLEAAGRGNRHIVELLLARGADVKAAGNDGNTAVHRAAGYGERELVLMLVELGANVNARNAAAATALHLADFANLEIIESLLSHGVDINAADINGQTALHLVANEEAPQATQLLIAGGAKVDARDMSGCTPLHWAVMYWCASQVRLFLDNGAEVNDKDPHARTPLHLAVFHLDLAVAQILLDHNGDIHAQDNQGRTPLHFTCVYPMTDPDYNAVSENVPPQGLGLVISRQFNSDMFRNRPAEMANLLLANGADINQGDNHKKTALHMAAQNGDLLVAKTLYEHGAAVDFEDMDGWTALRFAVVSGPSRADNEIFVEALIEMGANVNSSDRRGRTALHSAAMSSSATAIRIVEVLLKHNAGINITDDEGWSALHFAVKSRNIDLILLLLANGADRGAKTNDGDTVLHIASLFGTSDIIRLLLCQQTVNIDAKNEAGWTALGLAAYRGSVNHIAILVENGADINERDTRGETALHLSARHGFENVASLLLQYGIYSNLRDDLGRDGLHLAAEYGRIGVAKALLDNGACVRTEDYGGWTALHYAALSGNLALIELLVEYGADTWARDREGNDSFDIAKDKGHYTAAERLKALDIANQKR